MSGFKTADARTRERDVQQRTQRGLQYLNPEFGFKTFSPIDGSNTIRLVPPLASDKHASLWCFDVWVYYLNGKAYLSPNTFDKNAHDPVKEKYDQLKQVDAEAAKKFKGTKRSLAFVIDCNNADEELKLWAAPTSVIDEFIKIAKNRRTGELIAIEDPEQGRAIFFEKSGTGINTKYNAFSLDDQPWPLKPALADLLVEFRDLLIVPTTEELKAVIENIDTGGGSDDEDGGADRARPAARTRRVDPNEGTSDEQEPQAAHSEPEPQKQATAPAQAASAAPATSAPPATAAPQPSAGANTVDDVKARVEARIAARKAAQQNAGG